MAEPIQKLHDLIRLAEGDGEEARTAAHMAIKLMRKHGFVVTVSTKGEDAPEREARPAGSGRRREPVAPPPRATNEQWDRRKRAMVDVVREEVVTFLRTIDVIPRDLPSDGTQIWPARVGGTCICGRSWRVGEMVSRSRPTICVRCVARRAGA